MTVQTPELLTEQEARRLTEREAPCVYVLVDSAGAAIYVGSTRDISRRVREHASAKQWWPLVRTIETYRMDDWDLALHVERGLIRALSPEFNRQSVTPAQHAANRITAPMFRAVAGLLSNPAGAR